MSDEWTRKRHDGSEHDQVSPEELERQAREAIAQIRDRVGELGGRVRRVIERAGAHWEASAAKPHGTHVSVAAGERARSLARRWADVDFLVDPELPASLAVHAFDEGEIWRAEIRERGETRVLEQRIEAYRGEQAPEEHPALAVWDYAFPLTPDVEAGERRERVPGAGSIQACAQCGGGGRRQCATCGGNGTEVCVRCHGQGRLTCRRCRGLGRIEASGASRPSLQDTAHLQAHAERLLNEASERINFLRDRLRDDWRNASHTPVPAPSHVTTPSAAMIPCPECDHGTVACDCDHGRRACTACGGAGKVECAQCKGSGRVVQHREVVRRFDTRIGRRTLSSDVVVSKWVPDDVLARGAVESVWEGPLDTATDAPRPPQIPEEIWKSALAFAAIHQRTPAGDAPAQGEVERRVIERRLALVRLPLVRIEYLYAEKPYVVVAFGREGAERFWAERFPHRWSRVGRFLRALSRDLGETAQGDQSPPGQVSSLVDYRAQRNGAGAPSTEQTLPPGPGAPPAPSVSGEARSDSEA